MRSVMLGLQLLLFISTSGHARPSFDPAVQTEIVEKVLDMMKKEQIPGLAFSVVSVDDFGRVASFSKGIGTSAVRQNGAVSATVTSDTLFRVASISKTLTARMLIRLLDSGCLQTATGEPVTLTTHLLDVNSAFTNRLRRHANARRLRQTDFWKLITLDDILRHQSGLEIEPVGRDRWSDYELLSATGREMSDSEFDLQIDRMGFAYEPGKIPSDAGIKYSNLGFNILGRLLGDACSHDLHLPQGGSPAFEALVDRDILKPLKMLGTLYNLPRTSVGRARHSRGFSPLRPSYDKPRSGEIWYKNRIQAPLTYEPKSYSPSSGLATSAKDMIEYLRAYLLNIKYLHGDMVSRKNLMTLIEPNVVDNAKRVWGRGHLWFDYNSPDRPIGVGHTGTDTSHRSVFLIFPQYGLGAAVLINAQNAEREAYVFAILNILLRHGYSSDYTPPSDIGPLLNRVHNLAQASHPKPPTPVVSNNDIPESIRPLVGVYSSRLIDDVKLVYTQNQTLALDLGSGNYEELIQQPNPESRCAYDKFVYVLPTSDFYHGDKLGFQCDSHGKVEGVIEANGSYFDRRGWGI